MDEWKDVSCVDSFATCGVHVCSMWWRSGRAGKTATKLPVRDGLCHHLISYTTPHGDTHPIARTIAVSLEAAKMSFDEVLDLTAYLSFCFSSNISGARLLLFKD